jgi:hypothetical protein
MKDKMQNMMDMSKCMMGGMMGQPASEKSQEKAAPEKQKEAPAKTDAHGH